MSGKKSTGGKITLGMLKGKSITTSVPSFAIRFHTGGEELEDIYPSAEDSDDEAEKPGVGLGIKKDDAGSLSDSATQSLCVPTRGTTLASALSPSTGATPTTTTTSAATTMVSGTPSVTITSAPSRDPSPMKEYLKGLGKRSTSMDAGMMDTSSGSDTWRIFHELKGKITKTVEEKFSEKFADKKTGPEVRRGRLGSGSSKSKENSSISDEEISEQSGQKTNDPKQTPPRSDSSPKKTIEDKKSLSFEEKDEVLSDSLTDPPSTSSAVDISDMTDISSQGLTKKTGFRSKMKHNLSGLRNRSRAGSAPVAGIKMSSLSASAEKDVEMATDSDIEPAVEASEETGFQSEQLIDVDRTIPTTDYRTSVPTSHPPIDRPKKYKNYFGFFTRLWASKLILLGVVLCIYSVFYNVSPSVMGFFLGALLVYMYFSIRDMIRNLVVPRMEPTTEFCFSSPSFNTSATDLPILEVPAVKEYQPLTKYEGWVNEYPDSYDPETYSITATQTVYVRLEGSTLRISHTRLKIPKRAMWNERKHKLRFSHQRIYNIANCCVKLLPEGLTRRRLWSKKYPICVILLKTSRCSINVMKESPTDETSQRTGIDSDGFDVQSQSSDTIPDSRSDWDENSYLETKSGEMKSDDEMSMTGDVSDEDTFCHIDKTALEETCLYLFARTDREKEDWYRRLVAAVKFHRVEEEEEETSSIQSSPFSSHLQTPVSTTDPFLSTVTTATTAAASSVSPNSSSSTPTTATTTVSEMSKSAVPGSLPAAEPNSEQQSLAKAVDQPEDIPIYPQELEDECSEYLKFMSTFKLQVLTATGIRLLKHAPPPKPPASPNHSKRGKQKIEEDLCNSIERDVAPNLMWFNAFLGRILFDLMRNPLWVSKLQERIQKKLSAIRLPHFVGEILVSDIDIGESVPLIHCASRPMLDERGIWVNIDITYKGNASLTLETKLNLMKLKKDQIGKQSPLLSAELTSPAPSSSAEKSDSQIRNSPMFDSDLDDSAESSDDDSDFNKSSTDEEYVGSAAQNTGGTGKRILRMVNKIAASKYFQHATDNKYIKRAMEEVSNTRIILSVEVKGLAGTLTLNFPPPPSDRLWYGFRGCPNLALTARPKFGERQVNISHVVTWIEKQLIKEFQKKLVLPNMDDLVIGPMKDSLPK